MKTKTDLAQGLRYSQLTTNQRQQAVDLAVADGRPNCIGLRFHLDPVGIVVSFTDSTPRIPHGTDLSQVAQSILGQPNRVAVAAQDTPSQDTLPVRSSPKAPFDCIVGKTLIHIETRHDNPNGAGIPVCSIPKSRKDIAELIVLCLNEHESLLTALEIFNAFYNDLSESNPGFMGKMVLQNYAQWNEALLRAESLLSKHGKDPHSCRTTH